MNQVVLVDDHGNITGTTSIEDAHQKGLFHQVSVVYLINDLGQILIQHRSEKSDGRLDHSSAGHVDPGESYLMAAKRELEEELGITGVDLEQIAENESDEYKKDGTHVKHKYVIYKGKGNPGKINEDEVQDVFWADPKEILADMQNDPKNIKYAAGFKVTIKDFLSSS